MFKVNQAVKIGAGKYVGLVGIVVEVREATGMVRVKVEGVIDDEPLSFCQWVKASKLERHA